MSRTIKPFLLLVSLGACMMVSEGARASDWGCKVLLCLSDPRGPRTETECVPPIDKLYETLARGGSMPGCEQANGSKMRRVFNPYGVCPSGLVETTGWVASAAERNRPWQATGKASKPNEDGSQSYGVMACVGSQTDAYRVEESCEGFGGGDSGTTWKCTPAHTVRVFDQVVPLPPNMSGRAIEIFDGSGTLQKRVHY